MAEFTPDGFARLSHDDQMVVNWWLFEHGIDPLRCVGIDMDEGRFVAQLCDYDRRSSHPWRVIVGPDGEVALTAVKVVNCAALDPGVLARWWSIEHRLKDARRG